MLDVSKETHIEFLRAAVAHLQTRLVEAEKKNQELELAKKIDEEICKALAEELLILRKKFFNPGREKQNKNGPKASVNRKNLPHNRPPEECPEPESVDLVSEEVTHKIIDSSCTCSGDLEEMKSGFESSTEIDVVMHRYKLITHKRQKYICKSCSKMVTAPGAPKLKSGCEFSLQMATQVATDKFEHHIPLNRQCQQLAKHGVQVGAKTLFRLTSFLHDRLGPLVRLIKAEVLARPQISIDEAPMRILATDQQGYVWVLANNYGAFYQYEMTRSGAVAREMLKGFKGVVMCDGYSGYHRLQDNDGLIYAQCWAHCRRKFFDAMAKHPEAKRAIELIDRLFEIDRKAKDLQHLGELRATESKVIIAEFEAYLESRRGKFLESMAFGKAVTYYDERKDALHQFLNHSVVPLDNNTAERSLRAPVMGRNNFQGFRSIDGADVAMTFYSIIASCKAVKVEPRTYMLAMAIRSARAEELMTPYQYAVDLRKQADLKVASEFEVLRQAH